MTPARRIEPQPWMTAPETARLFAALAGGGATARFVGGCVRNTLLGHPASDVDVAVDLAPEAVMRCLETAGIEVVATGIRHGTITAVLNRHPFEVTTLRRDIETDGRRAVVAFTDDWAADAARRDFTMNALFLDPDGTVYDPVGGLADLEARRVRFVGDPETRIREDVLRLLRFFRFHAHYGAGDMDAAALEACTRLAALLPALSGERVRAELLKLLAAANPMTVVPTMAERGILREVLSEPFAPDMLAALVAVEAEAGEPADPLRRLAALVTGHGDAPAIAARLRLSNAERDRLIDLVAPDAAIGLAMPRHARRACLYRIGQARFRDHALLNWAAARAARSPAGDGAAAWQPLLAEAAAWQRPRFPLGGRDALALGVSGPAVGRLLRAVEEWWVEGEFRAGRRECLARLRDMAVH